MITIRRALEGDLRRVLSILEELNLGHPSLLPGNFHVAAMGGRVVGVANLEDCGPALYLSAVGVVPFFRKRGVAHLLIETILSERKKDAYVYTYVPEFFSKLGFSFSDVPAFIPGRDIYDCRECDDRERCVCMVRKQNAAAVS